MSVVATELFQKVPVKLSSYRMVLVEESSFRMVSVA